MASLPFWWYVGNYMSQVASAGQGWSVMLEPLRVADARFPAVGKAAFVTHLRRYAAVFLPKRRRLRAKEEVQIAAAVAAASLQGGSLLVSTSFDGTRHASEPAVDLEAALGVVRDATTMYSGIAPDTPALEKPWRGCVHFGAARTANGTWTLPILNKVIAMTSHFQSQTLFFKTGSSRIVVTGNWVHVVLLHYQHSFHTFRPTPSTHLVSAAFPWETSPPPDGRTSTELYGRPLLPPFLSDPMYAFVSSFSASANSLTCNAERAKEAVTALARMCRPAGFKVRLQADTVFFVRFVVALARAVGAARPCSNLYFSDADDDRALSFVELLTFTHFVTDVDWTTTTLRHFNALNARRAGDPWPPSTSAGRTQTNRRWAVDRAWAPAWDVSASTPASPSLNARP